MGPSDFKEHITQDYLVGSVFAFRSFRIDPITRTLGGVAYHQEIAPGVNIAQCARHTTDETHTAPQEGCTCGWYAYDEDRVWGNPLRKRPSTPWGLHVSAIVRLSGKIIVCERGLKAEYMEVVAVATDPSNANIVAECLPDVEVFFKEAPMLEKYPLQKLSRGNEGREKEVGVIKRRVIAALSWIMNASANLWASPTFKSGLYYFLTRLVTLILWGIVIVGGLAMFRAVFPPDSLGGFGSLAPVGALILFSPLLHLGRSIWGVGTYFLLLLYGILGSERALIDLADRTPIEPIQVAFIVFITCVMPLTSIIAYIGTRRDALTPPPVGFQATGSSIPATAGAGTAIAFANRNRLPKKVKSSPSRDGSSTPDTTNKGGQHG